MDDLMYTLKHIVLSYNGYNGETILRAIDIKLEEARKWN